MNMREQQFLLELADLIGRYNATFYYTKDDDGIHIELDGGKDCFVGFDLDPKELKLAAV